MRFYMDYNASAPIHDEVMDFMIEAYKYIGNPSSIHTSGRQSRALIEDARESIGKIINTKPQNIIFTSGATEANSMIPQLTDGYEIIISSIEHPSILNQFNNVNIVSADINGLVSVEHLDELLKNINNKNIFVSIMAVNNETGVIQPIEKISKICKKYGAIFHVDAVQAIGRIPISMESMNLDLITLSSHKIGGPKGIGCLAVKHNIKGQITPLIKGGGQERGYRGGTESVAQIAGFGKAIELSNSMKLNETINSRNAIEKAIKNKIKNVRIIGENSPRVANTSSFSIGGISANNLVIALDLEGYEVSSGSACSSGKITESHVLKAMGIEKDIIKGAIRVSLSEPLSDEVVGQFSNTLCKIVYKFKNKDDK